MIFFYILLIFLFDVSFSVLLSFFEKLKMILGRV